MNSSAAGGGTGEAPDLARAEVGERFADFTVLDRIGVGGATTVHRAVHRAVGVEVALKVWRHRLTPIQREQFLHECRLQWKMSDHPHVVRLLWAAAPDDGFPWIATELHAESLAGRLRTGPPLTAAEQQTVAADLVSGLAAIHRSGLLHRDVKPANVMLTDGRAALGDFGIAIPADGVPRDPAAGSELYTAPELAAGAAPSTRADVFSAAMTIRAMSAVAPAPLETLLTRAGSFRPADRPADAGELLALLREVGRGPGPAVTDADTVRGADTADPDAGPRSRPVPTGRTPGVRTRWCLAVAAALAFALVAGRVAGPLRHDGAPESASPTAVVVPPQPTRPGAPRGVVVRPAPDITGAADVRWSPGSDDVERHTATAAPVGGAGRGAVCTVRRPATSCRLTGLTDGVSYTVTVVAANAVGSGPPGPAARVVTHPAVIAGPHLALWLDGADPQTLFASASCSGTPASGAVGCWADKSPRANDAAQGAIAARPTLATSSPAAPEFGGQNSLSLVRPAALPAGAAPSTTFVVATLGRPVAGPARVAMSWGSGRAGGAGRVFGKAEGNRTAVVGVGGVVVRAGRWSTDSASVLVGQHTPDGVRGGVDGVDAAGQPAAVDTQVTEAYVGRDPQGEQWRGAIDEIIVFDRVLSSSERASVETYLDRKWDVGTP